jgi:GAF domain-containing protein
MIQNTVPSRYYCSVAENCIGKSMSALDSYLLTQSQFYRNERKQIWEETFKSALDSLIIYTKDWHDNSATTYIYDIRIKSNRLKSEQDRIEEKNLEHLLNADDAEKGKLDFYKIHKKEQAERLNSLANDIIAVLDLIINLQQEEINRMESQIRYDEQNLLYFITPFLLLLIAVIAYLLAFWNTSTLLRKLKPVRQAIITLETGNLPSPLKTGSDELRHVSESVNSLTQHLQKMKSFAVNVGDGKLDAHFDAFSAEGELGKAFLQMRDSLQSVAEKESKSNWVVRGISHFVEVLRDKEDDLKRISEVFAVELAKYLNAAQTGVYIAETNLEGATKIELTAFYAYDVLKQRKREFEVGEGLIGEAFQEKRLVYLKEIPENYLLVTSGLGQAEPKYLLIVPLMTNEQIAGLVEIASFREFEPHHIEFMQKVSENFASEVLALQNNLKNKRLLQEAQRNAEQLRTQEEEMRQNMEELQATQEEMIRKEAEINRMLQEAQAREAVMKKYTQNFTDIKAQLSAKSQEVEALKKKHEEEKQDLMVEIENLKSLLGM